MNASSHPMHSSTPAGVPDSLRDALSMADEDEFAIGCECANPALQIEMWGSEAAAQPSQRLS